MTGIFLLAWGNPFNHSCLLWKLYLGVTKGEVVCQIGGSFLVSLVLDQAFKCVKTLLEILHVSLYLLVPFLLLR